MTDNREGIDAQASRPVWRTPTLSDAGIPEVTFGTYQAAGSDGVDPTHPTTGVS
ncbi:hypothetical protein QH494_09345 [Sphingomonas sp. AR_OL41]|jgi:hypothetical protein|uniref:hypothetical protein n=1 Tax=Sphingomonas sp. AR_OL41 TaxID=3042729 RepID=UPI002480BA2B|nr:hypothetical protein [Sphingomonas sp. AR_OL41]MDH7972385.1 hypothetical protein [Sphingomonas sp. AR_OL41]